MLLPYKFSKILLRSSSVNENSPIEVQNASVEFKESFQYLKKIGSVENPSISDYISLFNYYRSVSKLVEKTDEDIFPLCMESAKNLYGDSAATKPVKLTGTEKKRMQANEHAILGIFNSAFKNFGKHVSLYEVSKTNTDLIDDSEDKTFLQFYRGFVFFEHKLLYLSENEYNKNINWLNNNKNIAFKNTAISFKNLKLDSSQVFTLYHGVNYLFRGCTRLMMETKIGEENAFEDFDVFLSDAKVLGMNNELTWGLELYLGLKKDNKERAISALNKFKTSNLMSANEIAEIDQSIIYIQDRDKSKTLITLYDKVFLGKIASRYVYSVLGSVNWAEVLENRNVPYVSQIIALIARINELQIKMERLKNGESLEDAGKDLLEKGSGLFDKAKAIIAQ